MDGGDLAAHLAAPVDRDAKWRHRFYDLLDAAELVALDPPLIDGPDGFPYLALSAVPNGSTPLTMAEVVGGATTSGTGAIVHAHAAEPWVFSCGDLVTRRAFGTYEFPRVGLPTADGPTFRSVRKELAGVSIGAAPATLLPGFIQPVLHRYFTQVLGIERPAALALLSGAQDPPEQLVFRLARTDFADDAAFEAALAGVTWFLPRHVVISVLPADVIAGLDRVFVPLGTHGSGDLG